MKKRFIVLGFIFLFIIILTTFWLVNCKKRELKNIEIKDMFNAINNKKDLIVYYGQEDCGDCKQFSKILYQIMEDNDAEIYYMDLNKMSTSDKEKFEQFEIKTTPALIVLTKGKIYIYRNLDNKADIEKAVMQINVCEERFNELKNIDYDGLSKKTEENIDFFLYIGREDCRDCEKFYPVIQQYISENPGNGVYYFDIKQYRDLANSDNASEKDTLFYENLKKYYQIKWVPSVYHIRNGIIVDKYEYLNEEYYELNEEEQQVAEQSAIREFEDWMRRECLHIE